MLRVRRALRRSLVGVFGRVASRSAAASVASPPTALPAITLLGNPILRTKCAPVPLAGLAAARPFQQVFDHLLAVAREAAGYGLAAPQIGSAYRAFVFSRYPDAASHELQRPTLAINPEIAAYSPQREHDVEACLSIPGYVYSLARMHEYTFQGM